MTAQETTEGARLVIAGDGRCRGAAQKSVHARDKLHHAERFRQVVVGTRIKPEGDTASHWTGKPVELGKVPPVLLSGNHGAVAAWRREQQLERTRVRRPDLLAE